jgi:hypothetical protein
MRGFVPLIRGDKSYKNCPIGKANRDYGFFLQAFREKCE